MMRVSKTIALSVLLSSCTSALDKREFELDEPSTRDSTPLLKPMAPPAAVAVEGFEHISWQKVDYAQGSCPVRMSAIFYWSAKHVTISRGDEFYTPVVNIHGGGWSGSADFQPPSSVGEAELIDKWVNKGILYVRPTYRGESDKFVRNNPDPTCVHPRELFKDAEHIVRAIAQRAPAIPQANLIRPGEKIRLSGGSAGGHVAMSLAAAHPDWFDRMTAFVGVYDLGYWHRHWTSAWTAFGERWLDQCERQFENKVVAVTSVYQQGDFVSTDVSQQNCARQPQDNSPGHYRVEAFNNPAIWAEVSGGVFVEGDKVIEGGKTIKVTYFFDASFLSGTPHASSKADGSWPEFNRIRITEVEGGSVPVLARSRALARIVEPNSSAIEYLVSSLLDKPSFLALDDNHALIREGSLGTVIRNGTGHVPPFRLATNTGDFALQEQALSFCNDIQLSDDLEPNQIISRQAKGIIYQCGDRGTLLIQTGGNHLSAVPHAIAEGDAAFYWLISDLETRHDLQATTCTFDSESLTSWVSYNDGLDSALYWQGELLTTSVYDEASFVNEWDATLNDPLYMGRDIVGGVPIVTWGMEFIFSQGELQIDAGPYGQHHEVCWRPL